MHKEIEKLPDHFDNLKEKERVELLIKLLPYAIPKVIPATYQIGEGGWADEL